MKRKNLIKIHIICTAIGGLTLLSFFTSTLVSELLHDYDLIRNVKKTILWFLPLILITMPLIAFSGIRLAGKSKSPIYIKKLNRMRIIAFNGIFLIFLAIYLFIKSRTGEFDNFFWIAQILELLLGAINLTLIILNIKLGFDLKGRFRKRTTTTKI